MTSRYVPLLALLAALPVRAAAPLDPAFLEYLETFADRQGEVFDPSDLALLSPADDKKPEPRPVKPEPKPHD